MRARRSALLDWGVRSLAAMLWACDGGLDKGDLPETRCDGADDDGDGAVDEGLSPAQHCRDEDGDGYGGEDCEWSCGDDTPDIGWTSQTGDCLDSDPEVHPGVEEVCDAYDNDCDGTWNEGYEEITFYADVDQDGYGDPKAPLGVGCPGWGEGFAADDSDCQDYAPAVHPGAAEDCSSGVDDDCDGLLDCEDDDCVSASGCAEIRCDDGLDEDEDGHTDCEDDECWGDLACPTIRMSQVTRGGRVEITSVVLSHWSRNDCPDELSTSQRTTTLVWWASASEVQGVLRVYEPGASSVPSCSWGFDRLRSFGEEVRRRSWSVSSTSRGASQDRAGFWIAGGCGVYDSAFLPDGQDSVSAWIRRYPYLSGMWLDGGAGNDGPMGSSVGCDTWGSSWRGRSLSSAGPIGVGERDVYLP